MSRSIRGGASRPAGRRLIASPTYLVDGVVHYCVTNMPGAVGRTSTYALCNVTLPYVLQMARHGWRNVAAADPGVAEGVNIDRGRVTNQAVAATFGLPFHPARRPTADRSVADAGRSRDPDAMTSVESDSINPHVLRE